MRKIVLLLVACCFLTACSANHNTTTVTENSSIETTETTGTKETKETEETNETESSSKTETENTTVITPLPETINIEALEDCTVAVSFEKDCIYKDENGIAWISATIHTYDLYDMVEISMLEKGNTINIRGEEIEVTDIDSNKAGNIFINGGLDNGGYDFYTNENGVYYESGYSDIKYWKELGTPTIEISPEFEYTDASDLDKEAKVYHLEDFLKEDSEIIYDFTPYNTKVVIENNLIVSMTKTYTP